MKYLFLACIAFVDIGGETRQDFIDLKLEILHINLAPQVAGLIEVGQESHEGRKGTDKLKVGKK